MKINTLIAALLLCVTAQMEAQKETLRLSLNDVINIAQSDAPDVAIANTRLSNNDWLYQSFLSNYKPQISFNATLPNLDRSIYTVTLPTGQDAFVERAQMRNRMGVQLSQDIGMTGGSVFASTGLERIDVFAVNGNPSDFSYLNTPITIGFSQPISRFNPLKWAKKIEPLVYQEATKAYQQDMQDVAFNGARLFFNVLISQLNQAAARKDQIKADSLYNISKGRFSVGRIAETELLQIELSAMNADANLAQASLNFQSSTEALRDFLGIRNAVIFELIPPESIPDYLIEESIALDYARRNRSEMISYQIQLLEAERNVEQAIKETGFNANISGSFGLSKTTKDFNEIYLNPDDQEGLRISLSVPIADWGKAESQRKIAQSNQQLTTLLVEQQKINFERDIQLKVQQFDLIRNQVALQARSYEISKKRQELTRNRYYIGKIGITDLNIAVAEEDAARRAYIASLRTFWLAHYDLRRLTLYDFEDGKSLIVEE